MSAGELNDRALALLAGGLPEEADRAWAEALVQDPFHLEASLNRALTAWRRGQRTDEETVAHFEMLRAAQDDAWPAQYALGLVHLERRDLATAAPLLMEAARRSAGAIEVSGLLQRAQAKGAGELLTELHVERHPSFPMPIALTGDGTRLLVGEGSDVVLRGTPDLREQARLVGHAGSVSALAVTPDGRLGLSGSHDHTLRLWDLAAHRVLRVFEDPGLDRILSVALSADGRWAACAGLEPAYGQAIRSQGEALARWHEENPGGCALPADIPEERVTHLFRLDREERRVLERGREAAREVRLSADGRFALCLGGDFRPSRLRRLELSTGQAHEVDESEGLALLAEPGAAPPPLRAPRGAVPSVQLALSGDAQRAVWATEQWRPGEDSRYALRCYHLPAGRCLRTLPLTCPADAVQLSRDGRIAVSANSGQSLLQVWRFPLRWEPLVDLQRSPAPRSAGFRFPERSADALQAEAEEAWRRRDFPRALELTRALRERPGHERTEASQNAWARLYRTCVRTGLRATWIVRELKLETYVNTLVRLAPDGSKVALAAGTPAQVTLHDTRTGGLLETLTGTVDRAGSLDFSQNARFVAAGGYASIVVWDLATGQAQVGKVKHFDSIQDLRLSACGRFARFASRSGTKTWDGAPEARVREDALSRWLARHERRPNETAEGRFAFVLDRAPGAVRFQDQKLGTSRVLVPAGVLSVEVARDGQWLLTVESASDHQVVRLRYLDWELEAAADAEFDEGARPLLEEFRSLSAPPGGETSPRPMAPGQLDDLLFTLGCAGYGWLHPEGVRRALSRLTSSA